MNNQNDNDSELRPISIDTNLKSQNLEHLVNQFDDIGNQSQILQGLILLEISARCHQERLGFDEYMQKEQIKNSSLCEITHQHRTRLMNLAKFFTKERPMTGISITAGYEISAPKNQKVAVAVYNQVVNQNYPVAEIQKRIKYEMTKLNNRSTSSGKVEYARQVVLSENANTILNTVQGFNISQHEQLAILKSCYVKLQDDMNKQTSQSNS